MHVDRFAVCSVEAGQQVDNCGEYPFLEAKTCSNDFELTIGYEDAPKSTRVSGNIGAQIASANPSLVNLQIHGDVFEVSAGRFLQSAYRFRVGYSADLCAMNADQQGRSFDEYNLIFYRNCKS